MTLAFLGETPDELVPQLNQILSQLNPATVQISGPVEYREQEKLAFLAYNEVGGNAIWDQLNAQLKALNGYTPQFSPWLPHTTIWRYAPDHKPNISPPLPSINFVPTAVTLYQSVKNPAGGANYVKVGRTLTCPECQQTELSTHYIPHISGEYGTCDNCNLTFGLPLAADRKTANIFDPIQDQLDQRVFRGQRPLESVVKFIEDKFFRTMDEQFVENPRRFFDLVLTGSLTTYQYSESSDCDMSVFVHYDELRELFATDPGNIRKELIALVTTELDGTVLPGSGHPLQFFIIPPGNEVDEYFAKGMRSGWSLNERGWLVPPERNRSHDISSEMPELYSRAAMMADKLKVLLDSHEIDAAKDMFAGIHKKRNDDEGSGLGDFSEGNIVYKFLLHEGLFDRLRNEAGVRIASFEKFAAEPEFEKHGDRHPIYYDFDRDRIAMTQDFEGQRGTRIIGEYDGKDAFLHGTSKEWINPNYFKRLWVATFPEKPLGKLHMDGKAIELRPADAMTYTQKLPHLVTSAELDVPPAQNPVSYQFVPFTEAEMRPWQTADEDTKLKFRNRAASLNARARKINAPGKVRGAELYALYNRFAGHCAYDGQPGADSLEHVIPLGRGGSNSIGNMLYVHYHCNQEMDQWDIGLTPKQHTPISPIPTSWTDYKATHVLATDPWRKGKDWKDFIKNEGIIVDFQIGDSKDDPVEGRVKEINKDSILIEVAPGEKRTFSEKFLKEIKFRVRDDKQSLSAWKEAAVKFDVGDCPSPDCDYEYTTEDKQLIDLAHGWFTCPQCQHTHNVRTELDLRTSYAT